MTNATIMAGVLIFLTIAPFSSQRGAKILEELRILWLTYATLPLLILSTIFLLLPETAPSPYVGFTFFWFAKVLYFFGLLSIGITIAVIMWGLHPRKDDQKEKDAK